MFCAIGALAELSLYTDPSNTVAKSRIFVERVVDLIFDLYQLPLTPGANLFDKLREDAFRNAIPPTILDKLHAVRILGNKGAHDIQATVEMALAGLKDIFDLGRWMFVMFWNGNSEDAGVFEAPPNLSSR
ncbi:MAG: DUF4145 domain-containing protein [Chloracidobacterium sp.]|nr:DUF4145 domain-containing protein [Chloracidobacterium sp.]